MKKLAAISPRTQMMGAEMGAGSPEEKEYTRLFTDMAYSVFEGVAPEMMPKVKTFKVLETSMEDSSAAGVFIVDIQGTPIYIPVILASGKVKTPDMFYLKDMDGFLPLSKKWIEEVPKISPPEMGSGVKTPKTLASDVDIRALTQPPSTGRNVYASVGGLTEILERSPNSVKLAWAEMFSENPETLKTAYKRHGDSLVSALKRNVVKKASEDNPLFSVLTNDDSHQDFARAFGKASGLAFEVACRDGIVVDDARKEASVPVETSSDALSGITEPGTSGIYKLISRSGEPKICAVFKDPQSFMLGGPKYMAVFPNGDYLKSRKIVGLPTEEEIPEGPLKKALSAEGPILKNGRVILIKPGSALAATVPLNISRVEGEGSEARATADGVLALSVAKGLPLNKPHSPKESSDVFIPEAYRALELGELIDENKFILSPSALTRHIEMGVAELATDQVKVKNAGLGEFIINGEKSASLKDAVIKMASSGINAKAALSFLKSVPEGYSKKAWVTPAVGLSKLASIFGPDPAPPMAEPAPAPMPAPMPGAMPGAMPAPMPGIDPSLLDAAGALGSDDIYDAAAVAAALQSPELANLSANYLPDLEKALDSVGRILLGVQMNSRKLTEDLGLEQFTSLEKNLSKVFADMGALVIQLNEQVSAGANPQIGNEAGISRM